MMNNSIGKTQERYAKNTSKPNKQSNQNASRCKMWSVVPAFLSHSFQMRRTLQISTPNPDERAPRKSGRVTKKAAKAFVKQCSFVGRWQDLFLHWDGIHLIFRVQSICPTTNCPPDKKSRANCPMTDCPTIEKVPRQNVPWTKMSHEPDCPANQNTLERDFLCRMKRVLAVLCFSFGFYV